jgi:hypothetical protein
MGIAPPYLGDRAPFIARFEEILGDRAVPHNLVVTGLRGVGKTVLLRRYSEIAGQAGWVIVEREFSDTHADSATFAQVIFDDLLAAIRTLSVRARVRSAVGDAIGRLVDLVGGLKVSYHDVEIEYNRPGSRTRLLDGFGSRSGRGYGRDWQ